MLVRLEVETPAARQSLASLAALKVALGISASTWDARLTQLLVNRSALMAAYCRLATDHLGRRSFGSETAVATFHAQERARDPDLMLPWRLPVTAVASVVEDGALLDASLYQVHGGAALLVRLDADGDAAPWSRRKIVVTFTAGWVCYEGGGTTIPPEVEQACLDECRAAWLAKDRDPTVRSEEIPDVIARNYALAGAVGGLETSGGLLPTTADALQSYRNPWPV